MGCKIADHAAWNVSLASSCDFARLILRDAAAGRAGTHDQIRADDLYSAAAARPVSAGR